MEDQKDGFMQPPKSFATNAIHAAQNPEQWDSLSLVLPLVTSTTFKLYPPKIITKHEYSRKGNPCRDALENCLAKLENAKYGLCFASGMGSITALLSMFKTGQSILCSIDVYGGTYKLFTEVARPLGVDVKFIDISDPLSIEEHITPNTKMLWMESTTNPLLKVFDVRAIAEVTKENNILLAIDNTFLTPYFQRPLEMGANLVMHSVSKYISGHTDVIMGALLLNDDDMHKTLREKQWDTGIIPSPFDCYQVLRGLKTLEIRMQRHETNALAVAAFLEKHPKIEKVMHPGLPSHPQHELVKKQTSGHSGIFSCYLKGGWDETEIFLNNLHLITFAPSLGGTESLVAFPPLMSHGDMPKEQKDSLGITENLLRLSVGLENVDDLIEDLSKALSFI